MNLICSLCHQDLVLTENSKYLYKQNEYGCMSCFKYLNAIHPNIKTNSSNKKIIYYYLPYKINDIMYIVRGNKYRDFNDPIGNITSISYIPFIKENIIYSGEYFASEPKTMHENIKRLILKITKLKAFT